MVHESADMNIAVVGILYKIGRNDPFLAKVFLLEQSYCFIGLGLMAMQPCYNFISRKQFIKNKRPIWNNYSLILH